MISKPTFQEMVQRAWQSVKDATGLTNDSESSIALSLVKVFCTELSNLWDELELTESQGMLSSATGTNLDKIGNFYGVARNSAVVATTVGSPQSVVFTNNGVSLVTVPANVRVWTSEDPDLAYFTVSSVDVPAGQQAYVDVRADSPGEFHNIGAKKLTNSNLGVSTVSVTNDFPITNGQDIETDANYRVRIQNEILRREGSNYTAIRSALLEVPGVRDVQILNLARGTGTVDVLIYGLDRVVPQSVIDETQRVLEENVAAGISAIAKAPVVIFVDVAANVRISTSGSFDLVKSSVSAAVRGYIDNLPIEDGNGNGTLIYEELAARVQQASPDIIDSNVQLTVSDQPALKSNQTVLSGERLVSRTITIS